MERWRQATAIVRGETTPEATAEWLREVDARLDALTPADLEPVDPATLFGADYTKPEGGAAAAGS